ncbi:L-sorbose 1-phosphate reductase [Candidatus Epulonipiscium fishelsonii]|uniref:L-sorbose 1-phosphate reductase n=1 Tax=Candidatus Epulonipiscium fishelsonii TaxID=77094 RepID=A0ACC8X905_9FIRM|nr:L-sorbose 1-phosphate reductase [Epulopiscium sp. SCG-B11WGA-EpuloA1]ONI38970.1 L-sorbose 1-phosphate reductase [Epulopiscium sp. SCG-B05WGA-EpuloA1]
MQAKAAVLYGKNKIKVSAINLPEIGEEELLVKVVSNSLCFSTYKAATLGEDHKRVPNDIKENPIITGHEFAGIIAKVGSKLTDKFIVGDKFVLQPAMGLDSGYSAGYSYAEFGGNATYCIIPKVAIDLGCVLPYEGEYFANASLAEPMCCIIGAFEAAYHTIEYDYNHYMGIKKDGRLALLGATGPMGIGAIDYAINGKVKPKQIVVTDINQERINRAKTLISEEYAKERGVDLIYMNVSSNNATQKLLDITNGKGYDDVFVLIANSQIMIQADNILGRDGCLNIFAGPTDKNFQVPFNFYNVHYNQAHVVGTSGGSTGDMLTSLTLSAEGKINPSYMISHIGGLNSAPESILNLEKLQAGKRLIYPHIDLDLTAINDFEELGKNNDLFRNLAVICKKYNNIWSEEAEKYLFKYFSFDPYKLD